MQFAEVFGYTAELEPDRFDHHGDDFEAALAEYLAEPPVRILFESGAGHEVAGAKVNRNEVATTSLPPPGVEARRWWLADDGALVDTPPADDGADRYLDDMTAEDTAYSRELLSDLQAVTQPTGPIDWSRFADDCTAAYETAPLDEAVVVAGQGHVDLWLAPGTEDTGVQVTLTEIRPDGMEQRVQTGYHRPVHRVEDPALSGELRVDHTFTPEDREPLVPGEWIRFRLPIYPVTHVFRPGSRLRIALSTPGRDHPYWNFESPVVEGASHMVGRGGAHASALVLPIWHAEVGHPEDLPPHGALRGQPAREVRPIRNVTAST
jgi:putative CocE/NonD family hydrolase